MNACSGIPLIYCHGGQPDSQSHFEGCDRGHCQYNRRACIGLAYGHRHILGRFHGMKPGPSRDSHPVCHLHSSGSDDDVDSDCESARGSWNTNDGDLCPLQPPQPPSLALPWLSHQAIDDGDCGGVGRLKTQSRSSPVDCLYHHFTPSEKDRRADSGYQAHLYDQTRGPRRIRHAPQTLRGHLLSSSPHASLR